MTENDLQARSEKIYEKCKQTSRMYIDSERTKGLLRLPDGKDKEKLVSISANSPPITPYSNMS